MLRRSRFLALLLLLSAVIGFGREAPALAARREKQDALAEKLLRELSEQYPDNALFALEYAKARRLLAPVAR
jgi:hypothetical protein